MSSNKLDSQLPYQEGDHYLVDPVSGCWIWQRFKLRGYARGTTRGYAHRQMWEAMHGPAPAGHDIHHVCRNTACVNPAHLEAVDLHIHRSEHQRERSPLSEEKVREIRERAYAGESLELLGAEFGTSDQLIGQIVLGKRWPDVGGPIGRPPARCGICGKPLTGRRNQKYCSHAHVQEAYVRRKRAERAEEAMAA